MPVTNYTYVNVEKVNAKIQSLWGSQGAGLYGKLNDFTSKAEDIAPTPNAADFRIPFESLPGGVHGTMSLAGGAYPSGSGPTFQQMTQATFVQVQTWDINEADMIYTSNGELSKVNMKRRVVEKAMPQFREYLNIGLLSDPFLSGANGLVAKATGYSSGVVTCANASGVTLIREGMRVEIYAADLNTHRTDGVATFPYVDYINNDATAFHVTNLGAITPQSTDYFAIQGAGASLTWVNGLYYFNNYATSGTKLGVDVANFPQLVTSSYNASSSNLSMAMGFNVFIQKMQRRGQSKDELMGVIHPVQAAKYAINTAATNPYDRKSSTELADFAPNALRDVIKIWGIDHVEEPRAARDRIDYFVKKYFGKVVTEKPGFVKEMGTGAYWERKRNSDGQRLAAYETSMRVGENYFCEDPGSGAVIYGLDYTLTA